MTNATVRGRNLVVLKLLDHALHEIACHADKRGFGVGQARRLVPLKVHLGPEDVLKHGLAALPGT